MSKDIKIKRENFQADIDILRDKILSQSAKYIFAVIRSFNYLERTRPSVDTIDETADVSFNKVFRTHRKLDANGIVEEIKNATSIL